MQSTRGDAQSRRNKFKSGRQMSFRRKSFVPLHFFDSTRRLQLVVLVERFRDGQYSLVSFLIAVLLLTLPFCSLQVGGAHAYGVGATGDAPG